MLKLLRAFFCFLGVIFFLLMCGLAYLWFADPFEIRPMLEALSVDAREVADRVVDETGERANETGEKASEFVDSHPALSDAQEKALRTVGIDPAKLPTELTPEMEACFIAKLGEERVTEIQAGATPSAVEMFRARECLE